MEHQQGTLGIDPENDEPQEHEAEAASNGYLMSLVAVIAGLPFPFINLLACIIFYLSNRRSSYFVRWHCTQVLLSQISMLFLNSFGFGWTLRILFTSEEISKTYIVYLVIILLFNLLELASSIYAAIQLRKRRQVRWWLYGWLTDRLCPK